jgi:hypothetical protein
MDHIGMDVHKKESQRCILTEAGELIATIQVGQAVTSNRNSTGLFAGKALRAPGLIPPIRYPRAAIGRDSTGFSDVLLRVVGVPLSPSCR